MVTPGKEVTLFVKFEDLGPCSLNIIKDIHFNYKNGRSCLQTYHSASNMYALFQLLNTKDRIADRKAPRRYTKKDMLQATMIVIWLRHIYMYGLTTSKNML